MGLPLSPVSPLLRGHLGGHSPQALFGAAFSKMWEIAVCKGNRKWVLTEEVGYIAAAPPKTNYCHGLMFQYPKSHLYYREVRGMAGIKHIHSQPLSRILSVSMFKTASFPDTDLLLTNLSSTPYSRQARTKNIGKKLFLKKKDRKAGRLGDGSV